MNNTSKSFIWLGLLVFIALMAYQSYLKRNPVVRNVDEETEIIDNIEAMVLEPKSEFIGNQLENGDSPFDLLFGKGLTASTENTLTIKNQGSNDVIVFLKRLEDDKVIRNHYVKANTNYTFINIPNSTCYAKFYYGNDWNPNLKTKNEKTGCFEKNVQFVDAERDLMTFEVTEDDRYIYSSEFQITLETTVNEGHTLQETRVLASDFFK